MDGVRKNPWRRRVAWRAGLELILSFALAHGAFGANPVLGSNTVLAIKLARAVYYMLRSKTVFDPERLVAALSRN